jgi:ectoine hydroxylase-related dioxygenase (phytanoyl-CoA dioxygenase family)
MTPLTNDPMRSFAKRGFIVVPNVVTGQLIDAAMREIDGMIERDPPPQDKRGYHFYWPGGLAATNPLVALLTKSGAAAIISSMIAPLELAIPHGGQVSLTIPPWDHRPGGPHLDGLTPPEASGRPGTFTLLAGFFLTDQSRTNTGNLWVWPGSHRVGAAYLKEHGPEALLKMAHPTYPMDEPEPVLGKRGDLLLAHYLLGHNMGGNMSPEMRRMVYFRLKSTTHEEHWREYVQDELFEFTPVRNAVKS